MLTWQSRQPMPSSWFRPTFHVAHPTKLITGQAARGHGTVRADLRVKRPPGGEGKLCRIQGGHLPVPEAGAHLTCGGDPHIPGSPLDPTESRLMPQPPSECIFLPTVRSVTLMGIYTMLGSRPQILHFINLRGPKRQIFQVCSITAPILKDLKNKRQSTHKCCMYWF